MKSRHVCGRKDTVYRLDNSFKDSVCMVGAVLIFTITREERNRTSGRPARLGNFINPSNRGLCFTVYLKTLGVNI